MPEAPTASNVECVFCGAVPVADALPEMDRLIRWSNAGRLPSVESVIRTADPEQRASLYEWAAGLLRRPPLSEASRDPGAPWATLCSFLEAVRWDLGQVTVGEPLEAGDWLIPVPHPRVIAADRGERTVTDLGYSRTFREDGYGIEIGEELTK